MGEEYKESGMLQRQWTYTFTNADYDAAVARGRFAETAKSFESKSPAQRICAGDFYPGI